MSRKIVLHVHIGAWYLLPYTRVSGGEWEGHWLCFGITREG